MTIIRTDLGDTKENAARLRFEPSVSVPETNVQDAIDNVAAIAITPAPVVVGITGNITTAMVAVQTNQAGAITLTLPDSTLWEAANSKYGVPLSVFDISGNAVANPVTIDTTGGQLINGLASVDINVNFGGFNFQPMSGGGWIWV